jgi:hypothetical protein
MQYVTPRLRQAALELLARESGGNGAGSDILAAASGRVLDGLSRQLAQVIGGAGVQALLLRAIRLQKLKYPLLDESLLSPQRDDTAGEAFRLCLLGERPEMITEISVNLVATFAGLLAVLIGDQLAWNLLREAWPDSLRPGAAKLQGAQE